MLIKSYFPILSGFLNRDESDFFSMSIFLRDCLIGSNAVMLSSLRSKSLYFILPTMKVKVAPHATVLASYSTELYCSFTGLGHETDALPPSLDSVGIISLLMVLFVA